MKKPIKRILSVMMVIAMTVTLFPAVENAALADDDDIVTKLFQYRFKTGEGLEGHSFGNLFITAMSSICGDIVSAIKESSKVLLIRGRVLPATCDDMKLYATYVDKTLQEDDPDPTGEYDAIIIRT